MKYTLLFFCVLLISVVSNHVNAQFNYKNGFVITLENDTLFGLINDGGGNKNSRVCFFKSDRRAKVTKYTPEDIKAYRFIDDKYYYSQELYLNGNYKKYFTDVLLKGKVSLYYSRKDNEKAFFIENENGTLINLVNLKADVPVGAEGLYGIQNKLKYVPVNSERFSNQLNTSVYIDLYRDTLFSVFKASTKVQDQIDSISYSKKSLMWITKSYINEICKGSDCIEYEKDFRLSRITFGAFSGIQMSKFEILDSDFRSNLITSAPIGIFLNFPLKRFSDRFSIQTEAITTGFTYEEEISVINTLYINSRTIAFPVLLKYQIAGKIFSPSFSFGKETAFVMRSDVTINYYEDMILHKTQKGGWLYEVGMDYKLSPGLSLFTNLRYQMHYNLTPKREYTDQKSYQFIIDNDYYFERYKTNVLSLLIGVRF